jgi:hypothetical protein
MRLGDGRALYRGEVRPRDGVHALKGGKGRLNGCLCGVRMGRWVVLESVKWRV